MADSKASRGGECLGVVLSLAGVVVFVFGFVDGSNVAGAGGCGLLLLGLLIFAAGRFMRR